MKLLFKKLQSLDLYFIFILSVYFFSRLYIYLILKIEFTSQFKETLVQYLDVEVLKNNFAESLFYLHSQPPLFNFVIGLTEITFGNYSSEIYLFLFNLMGCSTAILGYRILEHLNINKKIAVILVSFYLLTPATILYENLFFYTHAIIFFLVFSGYHFIVYLKDNKSVNGFLFFLGISGTILTTSFFHLIWFLIIFLFVVFQNKSNKFVVFKVAAIPFLIVISLYLKNYFVFDQFSSSSWLGMNLARISVQQLDKTTIQNLHNKGYISVLSTLPPFTHYTDLDSTIRKQYFNSNTGIAILDSTVKRNQRSNFNNYAYLTISKKLFDDDLFVIKNYPQVYFNGIKKAFIKYFDSPSKYKLLTANSYKFHKYNKLFDAFIYGSAKTTSTGYTTIIIVIFILVSSIFILLKRKKDFLVRAFTGYALINIIYVMFVGNLLELGENNRFRYYTEIFFILLLGIIINELIIKNIFSKLKKNNNEHC
jgi:hypothetical protein